MPHDLCRRWSSRLKMAIRVCPCFVTNVAKTHLVWKYLQLFPCGEPANLLGNSLRFSHAEQPRRIYVNYHGDE